MKHLSNLILHPPLPPALREDVSVYVGRVGSTFKPGAFNLTTTLFTPEDFTAQMPEVVPADVILQRLWTCCSDGSIMWLHAG